MKRTFICLLIVVIACTSCASPKNAQYAQGETDGWGELAQAEGAFFAITFYQHWDEVMSSIASLCSTLYGFGQQAMFSSRSDYEVFRDYFGSGSKADVYAQHQESIDLTEDTRNMIASHYDTELLLPPGQLSETRITEIRSSHARYKRASQEYIDQLLDAHGKILESVSLYGQNRFEESYAVLLEGLGEINEVSTEIMSLRSKNSGPALLKQEWLLIIYEVFDSQNHRD